MYRYEAMLIVPGRLVRIKNIFSDTCVSEYFFVEQLFNMAEQLLNMPEQLFNMVEQLETIV